MGSINIDSIETPLTNGNEDSARQGLVLLNQLLADSAAAAASALARKPRPILFIVGSPRTGTTLLSQLLANTGVFSYVNNVVARFWQAPVMGALLDQSLGISAKEPADTSYESYFGATTGWAGPHEFGYFWRRYLAGSESDQLSPEELLQVDADSLRRDIYALQDVYGLPLVFKNLRCTLHIPFLAQTFPEAIFALVRRDAAHTAQSVLKMRWQKGRDLDRWESIRPAEYRWLRERPVLEQVAGQVHYIEQAALKSLEKLPERCQRIIWYQDLCDDPRAIVRDLLTLTSACPDADVESVACRVPSRFEMHTEQWLSDEDFQKLQEACDAYRLPDIAPVRSR
jgi:hypothetical protein